jgi:hypothetical protein
MSPETLQRLFEDAWREFYRAESQTLRMTKLLLPVARDDPVRAHRRATGTKENPDHG